jgi:acyl-CoA thioesterase FadM
MSNALIENGPTIVERRPRFEGSNICTWIGFKHVMYLVEEAILEHFRRCGSVPRRLFEEHGLGVEIVSSSVRILHALHMDDLVRIEVTPKTNPSGRELIFGVQMFVNRDGAELKSLTGKVKAILLQDRYCAAATPDVNGLSPYVFPAPDRAGAVRGGNRPVSGRGVNAADDELIRQVVPPDSNSFVWKWRVPYFYCHFTERMQHSGYLRLMEEVVDLFLEDRGISIWKMLESRRWIPVVPNARLEILSEALMEETIYTVYTVENIFKDVTYTSRMDCYVPRSGSLVHTATGQITHGYAEILNRRDWALVNFDEYTLAALRGANLQTEPPKPELQAISHE